MEKIKNFIIHKNEKKNNEKSPDYNLSARVGTAEQGEWLNLGACWVKEGKKGKFISCKLADVWVNANDRSKSRKGFFIGCEDVVSTKPVSEETVDRDCVPY